jgi:hypothetical protein
MPAGPTEVGLAYFATAKLAGYTAFCRYVIRPTNIESNPERPNLPSVCLAGGTRTVIGLGLNSHPANLRDAAPSGKPATV